MSIEFKDVQGLIVRAYPELPASCFLLLNVTDAIAAKQWLRIISEEITDGGTKPVDKAIQIAFTFQGLKALGMDDASLYSFGREFKEGMVTEHRRRLLGDLGHSSPDKWAWGNSNTTEVHIMLMLYFSLENSLNDACSNYISNLQGLQLIKRLDSNLPILQNRKEHFGFRDGISQPFVKGFSKQGPSSVTVEPGEFILGYNNEYGKLPDSPWVAASPNPYALLPLLPNETTRYDFGKNGSYMVFRQIEQDVLKFWKFMDDKAKDEHGNKDEAQRVKIASKMVGRWPSGAPLVECPEQDDLAHSENNVFEYQLTDPDGLKCPFGSHIRRTNPRDSLDPTPKDSEMISRKHSILRRGRPYGTYIPSTNPDEIAMHEKINEERGLYFICFNTSISRQFEFIQDTWINNSKFEGLYDDPDPICGNPLGRCKSETGTFTIQKEPIRERITEVPTFTSVTGGAYFFMPGINAIKYLASIK